MTLFPGRKTPAAVDREDVWRPLVSLLFVLVLVLAGPGEVSARTAPSLAEAVERISGKVAGQWPPGQGYGFLMDANECHDAETDISLPLARLLRDRLSRSVRQRGYRVLGRSVGQDRAVVATCRWKTTRQTIRITFQLMPWSDGRRGKGRITSVGIARAEIPQSALQADMESWARTLIHRLGVGGKLEPTSIYQRPFRFDGIEADDPARTYFNNWFGQALSGSSLFDALHASRQLDSIETPSLRQRGIRPVAKKGISLTGDLLGARHEISGTIRFAAEQSSVTSERGLRPQLKQSGEVLNVRISLSNKNGKELGAAAVRIPTAHLPETLAKRLTRNRSPQRPKNRFDFELTTTRGEGTGVYLEGERIRFLIRTMEPAHVYLFDFDAEGRASLLYPAFDVPDKKLAVGRPLILPDDGLPYELLVTPPFGVDRIWAVAVGQPLDFPRDLPGEWSRTDFVRRRIAEQAENQEIHAESEVTIITGAAR